MQSLPSLDHESHVGNLSVGGSGKTPLVTALAQKYEESAVILRGYGRHSKGLYVVKDFNNILCDVDVSGDEAMIYAQKLAKSIVIVSEDRKIAILQAKEMGAKIIFLDDAYSKHNVKKLDRAYFAGITKKNVLRGKWRYLSEKEVSFLKML